MRKAVNLIGVMFLALILLSPTMVKADAKFVKGDVYSKYVSVGSELISTIDVGTNNFSGVVTYDNNVLEFVKVETVRAGNNDIGGGEVSKITHSVNGNKININYTRGGNYENILITFKVKAYSGNGTTSIKVAANGGPWTGEISNNINIVKNEECSKCEVCEECQNNENKNNNMLLYSSLGACGVLLAAVVILAIRKK